MKKLACLFAMICIGSGLFAFDRSLNGSWGIIRGSDKEEFIRFNTTEIILMDQLFRSRDFEEAENTIYIDDFDGDSVMIQYYLLTPNKLLLIFFDIDDPTESLTLILTKL